MSLKSIAGSLLLASLASGSPIESSALENRQAGCSPVHLLVARGSNEWPGPGFELQGLANSIVWSRPGVTYESIDYPALFNESLYAGSVRDGTNAVKNQLTAYVQRCPGSKVVLLGYSQGAQIVGDALCGGNAAGAGPVTPPIDKKISSQGIFFTSHTDMFL